MRMPEGREVWLSCRVKAVIVCFLVVRRAEVMKCPRLPPAWLCECGNGRGMELGTHADDCYFGYVVGSCHCWSFVGDESRASQVLKSKISR
jgi:hypothetical protein